MHDEIKKFSLNGEISDAHLASGRERMVSFLETHMREDHCVPALDLEPQFTVQYNQDKENYQFELTVYGVKVEGENLWNVAGVTSGKMIMKSTPPVK